MVVRVRELALEDGQTLRRIDRHGQNVIEFKRAQIVLSSYQGFTPPRVSVIALARRGYIRGAIRPFNEHGMAMLQPKRGPGHPPKFTDDHRKAPVDLALSRPRTPLRPVVALPPALSGGKARGCGVNQRGVAAGDLSR